MYRKTRLKYTDRRGIQAALIICVLLGILFSLLPLVITLVNSLKSHYEVQTNIFSIPSVFRFENYVKAFGEIGTSMLNSIFVSAVASILRIATASVLAYIFTRKQFMGREFLFFCFFVMLLVPSILGTSVLYAFMYEINLIDTYWAMWLPYVAGGQVGVLFLFRTFFRQQPDSIFEAAQIDGAGDVHIFFIMVLPLALPIILLAFINGFTSYYNDYLWPALVMKSTHKLTLMTMLIRASSIYEKNNMGIVFAMYFISGIPLIVTCSISLRYFQSGGFASGMKL